MYARADPCLSVLLFAKRKLSLQRSGCFILWYKFVESAGDFNKRSNEREDTGIQDKPTILTSKLYNYETYDMVMCFAPIPATTRGKGTAAGDAGQISARDR